MNHAFAVHPEKYQGMTSVVPKTMAQKEPELHKLQKN
jgi:hypothetical protein